MKNKQHEEMVKAANNVVDDLKSKVNNLCKGTNQKTINDARVLFNDICKDFIRKVKNGDDLKKRIKKVNISL
jgi:hypothetical protein